jgi:hypothetical protein
MLVLQDRNGINLWSSQSACLCERGCYTYRVTDAGTITVTDINGLDVYRSSAPRPGAARRQLVSASWGGLDCLGAPLMLQVRALAGGCVPGGPAPSTHRAAVHHTSRAAPAILAAAAAEAAAACGVAG